MRSNRPILIAQGAWKSLDSAPARSQEPIANSSSTSTKSTMADEGVVNRYQVLEELGRESQPCAHAVSRRNWLIEDLRRW